MSFTNLYYKRTAGTPKACFVCYRPTAIVLATAQNPPVDFIYVCDSHLSDTGFATLIPEPTSSPDPAKKPGLSPEELAKIKEEWEAKQKRKAEKAKEKKESDGKDKDGEKEKKSESEEKSSKDAKPIAAPTALPTPTHKRYTLHRDIWAMRQAEHRKRRQAAQAKALAPRLPGAPTASTW